jgi:hypothetical protein
LKVISQLELAQLIGTGVKPEFIAGTGVSSSSSSGLPGQLKPDGEGETVTLPVLAVCV